MSTPADLTLDVTSDLTVLHKRIPSKDVNDPVATQEWIGREVKWLKNAGYVVLGVTLTVSVVEIIIGSTKDERERARDVALAKIVWGCAATKILWQIENWTRDLKKGEDKHKLLERISDVALAAGITLCIIGDEIGVFVFESGMDILPGVGGALTLISALTMRGVNWALGDVE